MGAHGKLHGNYILIKHATNYKDAETTCQERYGTHLATIESFYDNEQVRTLCTETAADWCWIGMKSPFKKWADATLAGYHNNKFENWNKEFYSGSNDQKKYKLILRLKDISAGYFDTNLKQTGIENPDNIEANTFSIIGLIDYHKFKSPISNKWQFKLEYTNQDGSSDTIIWKQSSWIDRPQIQGYEAVSVPAQTNSHCATFRGLGYSDNGGTYLDGSGYHSCWWNSVGTIYGFSGGIPAFNHKLAKNESLYIYQPDGYVNRCGGLRVNDGKWIDAGCETKKYFVCNAMSYLNRLAPSLKQALYYQAHQRHYQEWMEQRQLEHMKELMDHQRDYDKRFQNDPYVYLNQMNEDKQRTLDEEEWEKKRKEFKEKGVFDPYVKNGDFTEQGIVTRFGPIWGNSYTQQLNSRYPVHFGGHRRLMGMENDVVKCLYFEDAALYEICVSTQRVTVSKYLDEPQREEDG